jgi:nucleotide-binding universal stress UspA family protein
MIQTILVPLDGSSLAERALPYGTRLASALGARLIVMHGRLPRETGSAPDFDVRAVARRLREGGTEPPGTTTALDIEAITHYVYADEVAASICETVAEQGTDLIIMATHGRTGLGRWVYGSVADQVLCQSTVPVLLVTPACDAAWPEGAPRRILVPLDGSRLAEDALEPVCMLATALQASLVLVGASGPLATGYAESVPYARSGFDAAIRETHEYLETIARRLREAGQTVAVDAEVGQPGVVIDGIARRRHVDLIAMATHGRSGAARLALGSVASELLQRSTIPLLVWRPVSLRHAEELVTQASSAR